MDQADHKKSLNLKILGIFTTYRAAITCWAFAVLKLYPIRIVDWTAPTFELYLRASARFGQAYSLLQDWLLWPWYRWDAEWYLRIAADGYQNNGSAAFAPLYPALIKILGHLFGGNLLLSALVISNVALALVCILLFYETRHIFDINSATRSVIYFLAFPTAFYMAGAYSESLFLLFVLLSWRFARKNQWPWAFITAILSILTRFQGVGLFIPLIYIWWKTPKPRDRWGLSLLILPIIPLIWALYLHTQLNIEFPWQALGQNWQQRSVWPWTGIFGNLRAIFNFNGYDVSLLSVVLDLIMTAISIGIIILGSKHLPLEYTLLNVVLMLPALMKVSSDGLLVSISRYVLSLWPNFMILGRLGKKPLFHWGYVGTSFLLQLLSSATFFLWFWVA